MVRRRTTSGPRATAPTASTRASSCTISRCARLIALASGTRFVEQGGAVRVRAAVAYDRQARQLARDRSCRRDADAVAVARRLASQPADQEKQARRHEHADGQPAAPALLVARFDP